MMHTRIPKPRSPAWWNEQEQRLRNFIDANPGIGDMTFTELHHGVNSGVGRQFPRAELASLCRLLAVRLVDMPVEAVA